MTESILYPLFVAAFGKIWKSGNCPGCKYSSYCGKYFLCFGISSKIGIVMTQKIASEIHYSYAYHLNVVTVIIPL